MNRGAELAVAPPRRLVINLGTPNIKEHSVIKRDLPGVKGLHADPYPGGKSHVSGSATSVETLGLHGTREAGWSLHECYVVPVQVTAPANPYFMQSHGSVSLAASAAWFTINKSPVVNWGRVRRANFPIRTGRGAIMDRSE